MPRLRFPDPLTLLASCVLIAAAASWVVKAGEYDRRDDPLTGRKVVVPGTFHRVDPAPVSFFEAVVAVPKGLADAAQVVFLVILVGGSFTVVDETGALRGGVEWLVRRLDRKTVLVIPIVSLAFATGGALENMQEEIIALVPVLLVLTRRVGYDPIVAVSMSVGAAMVGSSFSPLNPFQVGIAQKLAELPLLSGSVFRLVFLFLALALWIGATMRFALRTATPPKADSLEAREVTGRDGAVLLLVLLTFVVLVYGLARLSWDFDQMSALFCIMGVVAGVVGGLGVEGTARAFGKGFSSMAYAAVLIGVARAIYVVLAAGRIVDTLVNGLLSPLEHLTLGTSAVGMMAAQALIHVPVPSVSGQAVLTMPVVVPLADLLGLSRQVVVLSYQYGAGLCEIVTPTNGALMAILAAAGVGFDRWLRFAGAVYLLLCGLGVLALLTAAASGLR